MKAFRKSRSTSAKPAFLKIGCPALVCFFFLFSPLFGETVQIRKNGLVYNADYSLAEGNPESATFLITHGTLAHNRMEIVVQLSELLLENGYNVLAPNLSYSVSDRPSEFFSCENEQTHRHEEAVEEISMWANWLKNQKAGETIAVGHSRGGNQTARYSETADESVSRFILFAPSTWSYSKAARNYDENNPEQLASLLKKAKKMVENNQGKEIMGEMRFLYCDKTKVSAQTFYSYYKDDSAKNTPEILAKTVRPFLVLAASQDEVVPDLPVMMEKFAADNPKVLFKTIEDADHFFRDLNMDEAMDEILDFLEE